MINFIRITILFILTGTVAFAQNAGQLSTIAYQWKSVQINGGGFVDGIVFHPAAKGVYYCRTDIGGAYRWNDALKKWGPMMDWVAGKDDNLMGVESIALDPSDENRVYLACGTYTLSNGPNAVLRSADKGKTFMRTDVPFRMGGNENGRGSGERMAVDPNIGNILYMGTRIDGLWKSMDGAVTWGRVNSFPDINEAQPTGPVRGFNRYQPNGIVFIKFDAGSGKKGIGSMVIYAGVSLKGRNNLFRSADGGTTWAPVPGQPTDLMPARGVLTADGNMYIAYTSNPGPNTVTDGAVWKLNTKTDEWTDITPDKPDANRKFGYAGISVDMKHPQTLIVSTFNRYSKAAGGETIFRTTNGGKTWVNVLNGTAKPVFDDSLAPYVSHTGIHWLFDVEIDPSNPDHAIFTTGYGGHETFNLSNADKGKPTNWGVMSTGIEETVALDMISPPKGAALISAIGDYGGFVHRNLDAPAPEGNFKNPHFANTEAIAFAGSNPDVMVRVGQGSTQVDGGNIGYSLNGGKNWQTTVSGPQPGNSGGHVSVSADGKNWIWVPQGCPAYVTHNNGSSWAQVTGLPDNAPIAADSKNPGKFYAVSVTDGFFYTSTDSGATFSRQKLNLANGATPQQAGKPIDKRQGVNEIYATPGNEGDLWLVTFNNLFHSTNGGATFLLAGDTHEMRAFGFGKAAPGANYQTLYSIAVVNGVYGVYRSVDMAKTWLRINDDQHQWGLLLGITGDPKIYGRVYVGTHGRGIVYGGPVKNTP